MDSAGTLAQISIHSQIVTAHDQVATHLDGEVVILGFESGAYYGLDQVGAFIWDLLEKPRTVSEIRDAIFAEYEVTIKECERDLFQFLADLKAKQLVEVLDTHYS